MTFWKKATDYVSPVVHTQLKVRVQELEKQIEELTDAARGKLADDVQSSKFEIDFDKMEVFSLERNHNGQRAFTIVGYFINVPEQYGMKKAVHEWTLYCSMKEHERLVTEFQKWKNARGKK